MRLVKLKFLKKKETSSFMKRLIFLYLYCSKEKKKDEQYSFIFINKTRSICGSYKCTVNYTGAAVIS